VGVKRAAALALICAVLTGCGNVGGGTILGSFTLTSADVAYTASSCEGTGGFSDIRPGLGVTIKDEAGKIIGTTSLALDAAGSSAGVCRYTWSVPVGIADFYTITVGKRGDLTYAYADLVGRSWKVDATLGK
jgi:hypothetical protein